MVVQEIPGQVRLRVHVLHADNLAGGIRGGIQRHIQRALEFARVQLHRRPRHRRGQRWVGGQREPAKDRLVGQHREQAAGEHDEFAADAVGQPAEENEQRGPEQERRADQQVRVLVVELQRRRQEIERIKLAGVPHDALPRRRTEQRHQHQLRIAPARETFRQRRLRRFPLGLHLGEHRRFLELEPDVDRDRQQQNRHEERHSPAPRPKTLGGHRVPGQVNHREGKKESQRGRELDPAREQPAFARRRVFRDIRGRAAIFPAQRQALREPEHDQDHRRPEADRRIRRQHADQRGRQTHHDDGDEERVLPPDQVADPAKDQRAEGSHGKTHAKEREAREKPGGLVAGRKKQFPEKRGERAVDVEVVPLEDRAQRRGEDDELVFPIEGSSRGGTHGARETQRFRQRSARLAAGDPFGVGRELARASEAPASRRPTSSPRRLFPTPASARGSSAP